MPPAEVELGYSYKALDRVFDLREWEERLWVGHEAVHTSVLLYQRIHQDCPRILCNTFQHRPRLKDEGRQRDSAQVGSRAQL